MTFHKQVVRKLRKTTLRAQFELSQCVLDNYQPVVKYKILSFKIATIWELLQIPLNATI